MRGPCQPRCDDLSVKNNCFTAMCRATCITTHVTAQITAHMTTLVVIGRSVGEEIWVQGVGCINAQKERLRCRDALRQGVCYE